MKHGQFFLDFLSAEVNLDQSRIDRLNGHTEAVDTYLDDKLGSYRDTERQGSYALGTIIKPQGRQEYDADLLLLVERDPDKDAAGYIDEVFDCLCENKTYREKARLKTHCVTLDYAGDFHLDIVPCISDGQGQSICNRDTNEFEPTDGTGYRDWFNERNGITGGNLKRVVRLLKYARDHREAFSVKSILLTTLAGKAVVDEDEEGFASVPATLWTVMSHANDFLQAHPEKPVIDNPALPDEDFAERWSDSEYRDFRDRFDRCTALVEEAMRETDHNESVRKWRIVFGDRFGSLRSVGVRSRSVQPQGQWAW